MLIETERCPLPGFENVCCFIREILKIRLKKNHYERYYNTLIFLKHVPDGIPICVVCLIVEN